MNQDISVTLPDLEVFLPGHSFEIHHDSLVKGILESVTKLKALQYPCLSSAAGIYVALEWDKVWLQTLVALELTFSTASILEKLTNMEGFKLKYFGVGKDRFGYSYNTDTTVYENMQESLIQLLPKMKHLQALRLDDPPGLTKKILQLLTRLKLNLKSAYLRENSWGDHLVEWDGTSVLDFTRCLDEETLVKFRKMLMEQNPNVDLSNFVFVPVRRYKDELDFEATGLGFTFFRPHNNIAENPADKFTLTHMDLRKQIGMQY